MNDGDSAAAMSPPGRPKGEFPLGGTARIAPRVRMSPPGRPKGEFPPGGTARIAPRVRMTPPGRPKDAHI
jgi:hypothetical protein